jgi:endonuclease/exonuclease/phosphatase family metal-dependent hydrolase
MARTWNVFHGRTLPPATGSRLEPMVRLVTEDEPDLVCLQEVPVWALALLERWSGMAAFPAVTRRVRVPLARAVTELRPQLVRSGLTGQANALLVARRHEPFWAQATVRLNGRDLPASGLEPAARRARRWRREPRVGQAVGITVAGSPGLVANAHLTNVASSLAELELRRLCDWLVTLAAGRPLVLGGDLNLAPAQVAAFAALAADGWSLPAAGIDHVLTRGLDVVRGPQAWPDARRRLGRVLLSDHAPVEAEMMWP